MVRIKEADYEKSDYSMVKYDDSCKIKDVRV